LCQRDQLQYKVNAESMVACFAVVIERARQRNPDLPACDRSFLSRDLYLYLVKTCDRWSLYSWSALHLTRANRYHLLRGCYGFNFEDIRRAGSANVNEE
jgi:hypothetical protein